MMMIDFKSLPQWALWKVEAIQISAKFINTGKPCIAPNNSTSDKPHTVKPISSQLIPNAMLGLVRWKGNEIWMEEQGFAQIPPS